MAYCPLSSFLCFFDFLTLFAVCIENCELCSSFEPGLKMLNNFESLLLFLGEKALFTGDYKGRGEHFENSPANWSRVEQAAHAAFE